MACVQPVLGINQPFPQRCFECRELFRTRETVTMIVVLREGDVLSVGRLPHLNGNDGMAARRGRVLWAIWLCMFCAAARSAIEDTSEPAVVRDARVSAELGLERRAIAARRTRLTQERKYA
jgi:hypothetical protein